MAAPGPEPTQRTARPPVTLMQRLVAERKRQNLTQAFVAQQMGVTQTCISYWESGGREISLGDTERYADVLGLSLRAPRTALTADATKDRLLLALEAFPEDDERHWQLQAYLFNLLAHKALTRADDIRRGRQAQARAAGVAA